MNFLLTLNTTFIATFQIFAMGAVGFFLVRRKIMDGQGLSLISTLLVNLFVPCFSFYQLTTNFSYAAYPNWWLFPLICWAMMLVGFILAWFMMIRNRAITSKREFMALVSFQNSGFIPLLLITTMFPAAIAKTLYIYVFLFLIGFDMVIWSLGVWFLTRKRIEQFEIKSLLSAPFVAIVSSLIIVFFGINHYLPPSLMKPVKMIGDCMLPMAMIVVGGNLGVLNFSRLQLRESGLVVFTKLIFLPLMTLCILLYFKIGGLLGFFIMLESAMPSATSLSVIARHYQIEEKLISQGVFLTHIVSIITTPFFLTLYMQYSQLF